MGEKWKIVGSVTSFTLLFLTFSEASKQLALFFCTDTSLLLCCTRRGKVNFTFHLNNHFKSMRKQWNMLTLYALITKEEK